MKNILFVLALGVALPAAAYQTGPANRANFDSAQQSTATQQTGYRSFSNYNNRYGQGVQTSTVQTSVAGSSAKEFETPAKKTIVGKQAAQIPQAAKPAAPTKPSTGTVATAADADATAVLQQVQGMMKDMQSLTGAAGNQPAAGGANLPAMPDMSSLMNGMMNPGATPAPATPAATPQK